MTPIFENIPQELRALPRWVGWRGQKIPVNATTGGNASSIGPTTWSTFEQAQAAYVQHANEWGGVGFVLNGDGVAGVDIDHCVTDGTPDPAALALLDQLGAGYVEVSPSGTGLRAFGYAPPLDSGCKGTHNGLRVELYTSGRYLTVTGHAIKTGPLGPLTGFAELAERIRDDRKVNPATGEISEATAYERQTEWMRRIQTGEAYHDSLRDLAASMVSSGRQSGAVVNHLRGLMDASTAPHDERWQARRKQIPELVRTAAAKFGFARAPLPALPGAVQLPALRPPSADDATGFPVGSEQFLASMFAGEAAGRLRWTPGLDWMCNHGTHWKRDDKLHRFDLAREVCRRAAGAEMPKAALKICAGSTAANIVNLARSLPSIVTDVSEWGKHPTLLNTPGGVVDLETGQSVPREGLLFTQVAGVAPAAMPTPVWLNFLRQVFAGDLEMIAFIRRMGGYCLTGSTKEQKLFFLHGSGANGKSVFLDVLRGIAGDYGHNFPSEGLMTTRNEAHPTGLAALHGKRAAISSEIEDSARWAASRIKALTGDETMTARFMRQDFFTFPITHKHVIAGNSKPRFQGDDYAMARRMVLIPFNQRFEGAQRDNQLPAKLKAEYPGILAWFIEGARQWAAEGLAIPEAVRSASEEYMSDQDDLALWVDACCVRELGASIPSAAAYASFSGWKLRNGEHPPAQKVFSQRLERWGLPKKKTKAGAIFEGLRLAHPFAPGAPQLPPLAR